jgi:V/A-type H+-transporting ATPase subunit E
MSFDKIESAIVREAESDAKKIVDKAKKEKDSILESAKSENERIYEEAIRQAEISSSRETSRQTGLANHRGRLKVLASKNILIEKIFARALENIQNLPEKDYMHLMQTWFENLPGDSGGKLVVGARDEKRFSKEFIDTVNSKRTQGGRITSVEIDPQISGGFILVGENHTIESTIESKITDLRETLSGDLARELFGK